MFCQKWQCVCNKATRFFSLGQVLPTHALLPTHPVTYPKSFFLFLPPSFGHWTLGKGGSTLPSHQMLCRIVPSLALRMAPFKIPEALHTGSTAMNADPLFVSVAASHLLDAHNTNSLLVPNWLVFMELRLPCVHSHTNPLLCHRAVTAKKPFANSPHPLSLLRPPQIMTWLTVSSNS